MSVRVAEFGAEPGRQRAGGFVEGRRFIAGWCELREDFRLFRADRIAKATFLDDRYSRNRPQLVKEWRAQEDLRRGVRK
ncbi:WYL domain-containing protein [Ralstonia solanacearum]|uniref:WYL domain-containing protein n=1 Tax=Ralstonia solanacearum TaxID=305 RepID=UPI0022B196A5|nr:WYL domain-containing protein [Ralstonia solanacearum]